MESKEVTEIRPKYIACRFQQLKAAWTSDHAEVPVMVTLAANRPLYPTRFSQELLRLIGDRVEPALGRPCKLDQEKG